MKSLRLCLALFVSSIALATFVRAADAAKTEKKDEAACTCGKDADGKVCGVDKDCCCTGKKASKPMADKKCEDDSCCEKPAAGAKAKAKS